MPTELLAKQSGLNAQTVVVQHGGAQTQAQVGFRVRSCEHSTPAGPWADQGACRVTVRVESSSGTLRGRQGWSRLSDLVPACLLSITTTPLPSLPTFWPQRLLLDPHTTNLLLLWPWLSSMPAKFSQIFIQQVASHPLSLSSSPPLRSPP